MSHREINEEQARAILQILKEECGYRADPYDGEGFVRAIRTDTGEHVCREYRFIGAIGSGGKFRNNGNNECTPYVDCYQESKTPERMEMIEKANLRLGKLFNGPQDAG